MHTKAPFLFTMFAYENGGQTKIDHVYRGNLRVHERGGHKINQLVSRVVER